MEQEEQQPVKHVTISVDVATLGARQDEGNDTNEGGEKQQ